MKVLIVDTVSYDRAPYLQYYVNACKEKKVDFDLFLWNRESNGGLRKKHNVYTMNCICPFGGSKLRKMLPMLQYRKNLLRVLKRNKYTHLVLINTLAPVMISKYVLKHFSGKYILDIRDYTYERISYYKKIESQLVRNSDFTTISSRGFLQFVESNPKIIINHNISNMNQVAELPTLGPDKTVSIGFVGSVRYQNENLMLINALKEENVLFKYIGPEVAGCNIQDYCEKNNIKNVEFYGKFTNDKKAEIYKSIDLINSLYGDSSLEVTTAVPNRYYDALLFKKPIIASKGTYLGRLVEKNKLGLSIDLKEPGLDIRLRDYIQQFDPIKFVRQCNDVLSIVMDEQRKYELRIMEFLKDDSH